MYILNNNKYSSNVSPMDIEKDKFKFIGDEVKIWPNAKLVNTENISIGFRSIIDDFVLIMAIGNPILIGKFVHIASFCSITGRGGFEIENFAGLSSGVKITTSNEEYSSGKCLTNPTIYQEYRTTTNEKITIKKHAIIGTNTVILPGITIGEGCAIGANSLVTKDTEPWSIYFGTPAKRIKARPKDMILKMEEELLKKYNL